MEMAYCTQLEQMEILLLL